MLEASGHLSRLATRGVLHTVSSTGVGSSVGTGISVGEDLAVGEDLGDRASGLDVEIGDGCDGGVERGLHCSRLPVSSTAFLF